VTGKLEHPNIIPIYRLGRDESGEPLIVMKQIEGIVWRKLVRDPAQAPRASEGTDPLDWHLDILAEVCNGIHYAHDRGILHRDLKPENIMVGEFGEVYVLDWGLAATLEPERYDRLPELTDVDEPAGTPAYMAPEMVTGNAEDVGVHTDVYLLGGLLHFALTGQPPNQGKTTFEVMYDAYRDSDCEFPDRVDGEIAEVCARALHKDPDERFESAEEFRQAVLKYKEHRESLRLGQKADSKLDDFRELVRDPPGVDDAEIRQVFGECRFGFEQALEASAANEQAREGLQNVLELMIDYELDREAYQSAEMLLADLPERRPDLEGEAERLRERQESRDERFEDLEEIASAFDVELGRHTRSVLVLGLGALWAGLGVGPTAFEWMTGIELGYGGYLFQATIVAAAIGGGVYLGREKLFQNEANRTLVAGLVMIFMAEFAVRLIGSQAGVSVPTTMAQEMMMSSMGAGVLGVALDRRLYVAAVPYAVGAVLAALYPSFVHPINGVTNVVAMGFLAWVWWPGDDGR
jgi:serine/threonine-protein kinase